MNTITEEYIKSLIKNQEFTVIFDKTTVCCLKLINGFEVIGTSACVDVANFDAKLGAEIAYTNAVGKIWELEGYRLQCDLYKEALKLE
jgi:hypothetical protein